MIPLGSSIGGDEVDLGLERGKVEFEAQHDIYRGDKIDRLTPERHSTLPKGCFAGRRESIGDQNSNSGEEDDSEDDISTTSGNETKNDASNNRSTKVADQHTAIATSIMAEFATPYTTSPTVLPEKLVNDSISAGPLDAFSRPSYEFIPASSWAFEMLEDDIAGVHTFEHILNLDEDDQSLSVSQFIKRIYLNQKQNHHRARLLWDRDHSEGPPLPISREEPLPENAFVDKRDVADHVIVPDNYDHINEPPFDLQQLHWSKRTGLTEPSSRQYCDKMYQHCRNERDSVTFDLPPLEESMTRARFKPQAMHTRNRASTPHFQLRHHFAVQDHLRFTYSDRSQVWSEYNWSSDRVKLMDFGDGSDHSTFVNPLIISTLALSTDHPRSICMVGGIGGEFAYKSLLGDNDVLKVNPIATGYITTNNSGVINHIDIDSHNPRQSHHAVISCNDHKIRTFDLLSGCFLNSLSKPKLRNGTDTGHTYDFAINCTAACPDGRLRVAVGDHRKPIIIRTDNGDIEHELEGHSDHGFACAWSPDARYVATAAQDRLVNVYDTRTWRILSTFSSHVSTHRSMKFSPVGGGARCLLLAEEADRVTIVNAQTFSDAQTHSFYGSIVGCDFEPDGSAFWVANGDDKFGGFMRYARTGYGQEFGLSLTRKEAVEADGDRFEEGMSDRRCFNPRRHGANFEG